MESEIDVILLAVVLLVSALALGNILGWLLVREGDWPFNWRVFLGPWVYGRWVE